MTALPTDRVASRTSHVVLALAGALLVLAAIGLLMPARTGTLPPAASDESVVSKPASAPGAEVAAPVQPAKAAFASDAALDKAREAGLRHFELAEDELALEQLVPVYRARPDDDTVALAIAEASLRKRDFKTAEIVVGALREPEQPEALRVRGALFEQANRLPESLALYERAIPLLAEPYSAMEGRARVLSWMQRFDEAIAAYRALAADANAGLALQRQSRVRIAELTAWKKDFDGALSQLAALLAEDPRQADALLVQGQILEWQGRYPEAKRSYSSVLAFDAAHKEARMRLDKLLWVK